MQKTRVSIRKFSHILFVYCLVTSFILGSGDDSRLVQLESHLSKFKKEFPQQKVYLHLDKSVYSASENIWLKAYLLNAASNLPDTMSTNLYVELINTRGVKVQSHILKMNSGFGNGDFILQDTVTEGNYILQAYTNWMNNFDAGFIFKKNIYIKNQENENFISSRDIRFNKKFNKERNRLKIRKEIQFLPEGGELVYGLRCRVAFKAIDGFGRGIDAEGSVKDNKGNEIAQIHSMHLGMGAFAFTPEAGKTYQATVKLAEATEVKINLPQPLEHGISVFADNFSSEDFILLKLRANLPPSLDPIVRDFMVVAQSNGNLCFSGLFHFKTDSFDLSISKDKFPTGIGQITIFSGRGIPVAERLVFINHHDSLNFEISAKLDTIHSSNWLKVSLKVINKQGKPVAGNFSAAFTDINKVSSDPDESNILNSFWLTSDIKGLVEKPGWYFDSSEPNRQVSLDLLMMTQGWRRFDWKKILANEYPKIEYPVEKGIEVAGHITRDLFGIPVKNAPVYLTILSSYNDYFSTTTDENGRYKFGNLDYYDTISVIVEATKPNGKKNIQILIDEEESPPYNLQSGESFDQEVLVKGEGWRYNKVKRSNYNNEIIKERQKLREKYAPFRIYNDADDVIYMDELPDSYSNMFQVIQGRVPGVQVGANSVQIRGINTLFSGTDPLYIIDGVTVDAGTFGALNPKDVELVEFLKGPKTSLYGSRGANGVIAAYTKRGDYMKRGSFDFKMLGYYRARTFYTTTISESSKGTVPVTPETIYWNPEIKTDLKGQASFSFAVKQLVPIRLVLEGMSLNGIAGYANKQFNF